MHKKDQALFIRIQRTLEEYDMNEVHVWTDAVPHWQEQLRNSRKAVEIAEEMLCYYAMKLELAKERQALDHQLAQEGTAYYEHQRVVEENGI